MNPKDIVYKMLVLGRRPTIYTRSLGFVFHKWLTVYLVWFGRARAQDTCKYEPTRNQYCMPLLTLHV